MKKIAMNKKIKRDRSERSNAPDKKSKGSDRLMKNGELKEEKSSQQPVSLMCHQCQRNDKSGVVHCSNCMSKRFCFECIERWYPGKTREEIRKKCPFCCCNCNCKACLRVFPKKPRSKKLGPDVKLQRLKCLLYNALPLLRHIHKQQSSELEIEAKIRGVRLKEADVLRTKPDTEHSERIYWYVRPGPPPAAIPTSAFLFASCATIAINLLSISQKLPQPTLLRSLSHVLPYIKFRYAGYQIYKSIPIVHPLDPYKKHYDDDVIKNFTRNRKL